MNTMHYNCLIVDDEQPIAESTAEYTQEYILLCKVSPYALVSE